MHKLSSESLGKISPPAQRKICIIWRFTSILAVVVESSDEQVAVVDGVDGAADVVLAVEEAVQRNAARGEVAPHAHEPETGA